MMIKRVHRFSWIYLRRMAEKVENHTEIAISARFDAELFTHMNDFISADHLRENHLREK